VGWAGGLTQEGRVIGITRWSLKNNMYKQKSSLSTHRQMENEQ